LANWFAWGLISFCIGGTAFNGTVEGDEYFLLNHSHYNQVSQGIFEYSKIHGYTAFGGLVIGSLAAVTKSYQNAQRQKNESPAA